MSENDVLEEFLLRYPGLIHEPANTKAKVFKGVVKVDSKWHRLHLSCPHFPKIKQFELKLQQLHSTLSLNSKSKAVNKKWTASQLIENLSKLLEEKCDKEIVISSVPTKDASQNVFSEVAALYAPRAYKLHASEDCSRVRFSHFAGYEQHYIELKMPSLEIVEHSLPDCTPWAEVFAQKCLTLGALVQLFQKYLEDLQPFYDNFLDIDELCSVVQPRQPTTKHSWRLFVLKERVFLKLSIADPFAPIASMSLHIIGPSYEVEPLRRAYSEGMLDWDVDLDIHKNLLRIFDLCYFPMPSDRQHDKEDNEQFCNICYCYELDNGDVPVVSCDNPQCHLVYHPSCLQEWFNTLADGKVFLDVSLGSCPFCKAKLSASFAELMNT